MLQKLHVTSTKISDNMSVYLLWKLNLILHKCATVTWSSIKIVFGKNAQERIIIEVTKRFFAHAFIYMHISVFWCTHYEFGKFRVRRIRGGRIRIIYYDDWVIHHTECQRVIEVNGKVRLKSVIINSGKMYDSCVCICNSLNY